jgi:methyl-accepting chemotaxis protein
MQLRTKLCLTTSIAVLALFGLAEWVNFRHTSNFLAEHEALLESSDAATALAALKAEKAQLFRKVTVVRLAYAGVTIAVSVVILNALWYSMLLQPLHILVRHINVMKRGTWTYPIPLKRKDEFGEIIHAFNELGTALTLVAHQYANASKLAALSLIGQRLVRRTKLAADNVSNIAVLLRVVREHGQRVPDSAIGNLELAAKDLLALQSEFEAQFQEQYEKWIPGVKEKVEAG